MYQIKLVLDSTGRHDPQVGIDLPFDKLLFEGGLKQLGTVTCNLRGSDMYTIKHYSDLNLVLGLNWHISGINAQMNFCYVHLQSVQYYLHQRQPLYTPEGKEEFTSGYILVFKFVHMESVKRSGYLFMNHVFTVTVHCSDIVNT